MPERSLLAESFASERLWVWQKRLNLQGWDISVVVSRHGELKPKTLGNIRWDRDKKTAVIRILDPADYHLPFDAMLRDIEFTVVHELIHLEMAPVLSDLQRTDANRVEEEHAVQSHGGRPSQTRPRPVRLPNGAVAPSPQQLNDAASRPSDRLYFVCRFTSTISLISRRPLPNGRGSDWSRDILSEARAYASGIPIR